MPLVSTPWGRSRRWSVGSAEPRSTGHWAARRLLDRSRRAEEVCNLHAEPLCYPGDGGQAWVAVTALDLRDEGAIQPTPVDKHLLGPAPVQPQGANPLAECA